MKTSQIKECFPFMETMLLTDIEKHSVLKSFYPGEYIVKQGTYIRYLPLVLEGRIKVFSREEDVHFLMYYISSGESCVNSFANILEYEPIDFCAVADIESNLLLLPMDKVHKWMNSYPSLSILLLKDYQRHYKNLLFATKEVISKSLEHRLLNLLYMMVRYREDSLLNVTHQELAFDLGTSREVVTRLLSKLKEAGYLKQEGRKIKMH